MVGNFTDVYRALDDAGGALEVADAEELGQVLEELLADATRLRTMARAAGETIEGLAGATARTLAAIEPYLARAVAARG